MSLFHWSPSFPLSLPRTDYSFTVKYELSNPPNDISLTAIVELRIRQKYMLILEPIKGRRVSLENDYLVSPELTLHFKIPLWLLQNSHVVPLDLDRYVSKQLASLPINADLGGFLKPHIQNYAVSLAHGTQNCREFKLIFSVMALKMDLADEKECAMIRARGRGGLMILGK